MKTFVKFTVTVPAALVLITGCAVPTENASTKPAASHEVKTKKAKTKVELKVTKVGKDVLGDYEYKVTLTNHTGENLDVDAFSFSGRDAAGNTYDAMPGSLDSVGLANGETATGTITFTSGKIVKVTFQETLGVDRGSATVKKTN